MDKRSDFIPKQGPKVRRDLVRRLLSFLLKSYCLTNNVVTASPWGILLRFATHFFEADTLSKKFDCVRVYKKCLCLYFYVRTPLRMTHRGSATLEQKLSKGVSATLPQ